MNKLLTIIIPSYNMELYLTQCLESLLIDDWIDFLEIIIVNDGSKDKTLSIATHFQNKFLNSIKVIDKINGNYGSCINQALKSCNGKYIKILDADDSFNKKGFVKLLNTLQNIDVDVVITNTIQVFENGTPHKTEQFDIIEKQIINIDEIRLNPYIPMHSITYKTSILKKINYQQTEGISYTDTEWAIIPFSYVHTCYYLPTEVYRYLIGRIGQTMDPTIWEKQLSQFVVVLKNIISSLEYNNILTKHHYASNSIKQKIRTFYLDCMLNYYKQTKNILFEFDNFIKITNLDFYNDMNSYIFGKKEKIRFIYLWRKHNRPSYRLYFFAFIHKFIKKII